MVREETKGPEVQGGWIISPNQRVPKKLKDDKGRDDEQTLPTQMMTGIIFSKDST